MDPLAQLLGKSPEIVAVREQVRGLLKRQAEARRLPPILIQGETGTGKGLVARAMHAASVRAGGPFVDVNCAAIPETLLEAEMFGVERGAFTDARQSRPGLFQLAHRGTIFLDEIGLLPEALQAKLLKVIEERQVRRLGGTRSEAVDVWVVAATNEDLAAITSARRFRADLYHRLAVVTFSLPALRDRRDDVLLLAEHFLARACADYGLPAKALSADARTALVRYSWPGNIRELSNVMERVVLLGASEQVTAATLGLSESAPVPTVARGSAPATLEAAVDEVERAHLLDALGATSWNVSQAAARLGISRNTLRYRIEKHGLRPGAPAPPRRRVAAPAAHEVTPSVPAAAPSPVIRERRRLTLLRAVLVAPASAQTLATNRRTIELLSDKARVFGGRVEEASGAGIVAVFGVEPVEDAPARAAHAAIAVLNGVERLRRDEAREIRVRVAIHVDQFLINHSPGSAIDPEAWPHAYAFLDSLLEGAEQDDIVVSEAAVPFLERRFDLMPAPVGRAFRLAGRERGGSGLRRRLTAFVGRQHELELLRSRFESAASGRGQVVGIAGDAGVGKSRLLHEFRHGLAGRAVDYLQGQCLSYGSATPFLPVLDMLRITCRIARRDTPEVAAEKVRTLLHRLGMNPVERAPYLLHLLGLKEGIDQVTELSPEVIKVRIFDTLRELTLRRSQRRPLVLALEDLHWIDETSEELFASMVQAIPSARIMLICIYRPGYRPAWIDKSYATQIALQPLPAGESLSFVRALLASQEVSEAVVQAILARAEGNAFFLEELARSVREQRATAPSLAVPDTVQEVLLARIDRLPPLERRLLQTAAVVGRDVSLTLLEAIAGLSPEDLERGLSHLRAAEFLYETGVGAEVECTFKHTLIQEVAYTSMADEDRRALHAAIVAATERLYADRLGEHIESLGHHAFAGGVWDKALAYLRQAGIKAARRSAHREAVACFEQALMTLEHLPSGRDWSELAIDVRFDLRTSLLSLGELRRILRVMQEAEALASALGDQARLGRVAMYMGNYFSLVGDQVRALETGRRALELATTGGDSRVRVEAHYRLGQIHCMLGDYRRAVETLEQCVKAVSGDLIRERFGALATLSVLARNWLVRSLAELGAFDDAIIRADEAMRVAEATNQPIDLLIANQGMGYLHLRRGQLSRAVASLERGVELCRSWHVPVWLPVVAAPLGAAYAMVERLDDAVSLLEQAVKEHAAMQRMGGHSLWVAWLSEAYLTSGRLDTASHLAGLALTLAQTHGERGHEAWILRLLGEVAARSEPTDPTRVEDAYGRASALAETLGMRPLIARCHLGRGRLASRLGDRTSASTRLTSAIVLFREMGMEFWLAQAESELGCL